MADASFNISVFNATTTTFKLEASELNVPENWIWRTSQTLMATLPPQAGQSYIAAQDHLGWLGQDQADMIAIWDDGVSRFGVRLHSAVKELGIGTSPYYLYMQDTNIGGGYESVDWQKPSSPATPVQLTLQSGAIVQLTPSAGTSNMAVSVNIKNAS